MDIPAGMAPTILSEVELGIGRPDLLLVVAELPRLSLRLAAGLRLANLTEALLLQESTAHEALAGAGSRHRRRLVGRLEGRGWFEPSIRDVVVRTSLLLEAKVSAWQRGVRQLSRVRWAAHRAALVLPRDVASRVRAEHLRRPGVGLVAVHDDGELAWRLRAPTAKLPFYVDAWLGELVLRQLEAG